MATTVFFVSGTSLTIPSNYNSASSTWEAIGGGGGASYGAAAGGGEYRKITNASYTSSATRTCQIGAGGTGSSTNGTAGGSGTFTQLLADNNSTVALKANPGIGTAYGATTGGANGSGGTGAGGNANGGNGGATNGGAGAGGGAAGGPNGVGAAGGAATTGSGSGGGSGGGGSNGGGTGGATSGATGGAGGNGQGGTGGGVGGTASGVAGTAGTAGTGAGGGGGVGGGAFTTSSGGNGATGSIWTQTSNSATAGPGGGGGGTGGDGSAAHGTRVSGNGGLYGGGGGSDGNFSTGTVKGGSGAQGIIVLTYTPAAGGSPYTMPAATGTVALAGQAATLTKTTAGANPVQKNGGTVSANASIATSLPGATTAGNTILIFASGGGTITTPSGFTSRSPAVNALGCYIFEKLVASGNSTDTPTLTMSGAYDAVWQIAEYKNITAYDTSSGTFSASATPGPYSTPTITPASGNKRIFGFVGSTMLAGGGGFAAGDPQSWTNNFIGQQSNLIVGPGGPGRQPIASGWSELFTAASGASYSTAGNIGTGPVTLQPHSIIAAYTTTDTPPVNPWPTFRSLSSVGYASHSNTVVTAPTSILDGDILILTIAVFGTPTPPAVTLPSGFTLIDKSVAGAGGSNVNMSVAWKRASSESGSYTITHATANTNAFIAVYSGCIASGSPVDAYIFNAGLGTTTDTTNLVSSVANTTALYIDHDWTAGGGRSPPTPMVERYENLIYLSDNPLPTSGTSGRAIATNSNVNGSDPWAAWSVLLKPAVSAGGSPYTMPAAKGSVTLAGTATGLRAARQLAAVKGSIALAGTTTGLRAARTLTAAKGSIALTGLATGLRAARTMAAVKGSIVLTGFAAGLVYSSFKTLTAAVGSITLAGQAATFRLTRVMAAAKGTISLTGFDVVLTKTSAVVNKILTAAAGAFTFVGQDAALRRERRLPAATGTVTLAGQAAVLRVARKLAAAKGTITLAGSDTALLKGKSPLLATTGAILVAGNTANLVYRASYRMAAASASIRLAAREAGLSRSGTEQPGVMEFGRTAYLGRW